MKWLLVTAMCLAVAVLAAGQPALAWEYVDIGNPVSEAGNNLVGWGPIEPAHSGGTFGGVDDCRAIWAPPEADNENWATLTLDFGPVDFQGLRCLDMRHLDGISALDDFEVFVNDNWVGGFVDNGPGNEVWLITSFDVTPYSGVCTVKIVATDAKWAQWDPYGQVCLDWIRVIECGAVGVDQTTWGSVKALYK
jgi:hypothetical protein